MAMVIVAREVKLKLLYVCENSYTFRQKYRYSCPVFTACRTFLIL